MHRHIAAQHQAYRFAAVACLLPCASWVYCLELMFLAHELLFLELWLRMILLNHVVSAVMTRSAVAQQQ